MVCILIIDDEHRIRTLLRELFEDAGYDVMEVPNGAAGLCAYRTRGVDVVIMDMFMPQWSGVETIHKLRQDFPQAKIIAISGRVDLLTLAQATGRYGPCKSRLLPQTYYTQCGKYCSTRLYDSVSPWTLPTQRQKAR